MVRQAHHDHPEQVEGYPHPIPLPSKGEGERWLYLFERWHSHQIEQIRHDLLK
jgi:hypothetical protein